MSSGFIAVNNNKQVLVSSDTKNLHFVGKATLESQATASTAFGGTYRWTYLTNCLDYPTPFFTSNSGLTGVTSIKSLSPSVWRLEIISNVNTVPEVYIFAAARSAPPTNERFGVIIYKDAENVSFDSRLKPLSVMGGNSISPPSNPRNGGISGSARECASNPNSTLAPDTQNSWTEPHPGKYGKIVKPIFHYSSIAQAQREKFFEERWEEGGCADKRSYHLTSTYWCFYRAGVSGLSILDHGTGDKWWKFTCGWIPINGGCYQTRNESGRSFIGINLGGGGSSAGGAWPYTNETINLSPQLFLVSDGSFYD